MYLAQWRQKQIDRGGGGWQTNRQKSWPPPPKKKGTNSQNHEIHNPLGGGSLLITKKKSYLPQFFFQIMKSLALSDAMCLMVSSKFAKKVGGG